MSKKIPAKPFSNYQEGKLQNPAKAQRQEPNVKSVASKPEASRKKVTPPSQTASSRTGSRSFLLFLFILATLASAYIGYELGDDFLSQSNRVSIPQTELTYETGDVGRLSAQVSGDYDTYDLFWTSSNLDVVYVDNGGNLAALNPGQAIITASVGGGSVKDTMIITVIESDAPTE